MPEFKAYIDTSLAIEYVLANGSEWEDIVPREFPEQKYDRVLKALREVLNTEKRYSLAKSLRLRFHLGDDAGMLVISPLVLYELYGWYYEERFKSMASEVTNIKSIQRIGQKQIGDYLKTIERKASRGDSPDFQALLDSTKWTMNLFGEGLVGITIEPLTNLELDEASFQLIGNLAYLQVGLADALHLLAARKLGCTHFATLDSDYQRVRTEIESDLGLELLFGEEILRAI
ncbi:MAG TPA: hypothetical protein VD948_03910 [Rhodothermales bacterium]|nr:hypothetical protein [Rhodothermales bacterium]